ncbi:translation initiation factor IF-2 [Candidatus Saccharibacteria bacterium]|nr:translation initiation factor IF-2 [Candidatus Saccharibacteria bacterium]MCA9348191.1 translation initiation factor IF-2 [Candidatus Saccharibacteria bacterium]
MAQRIIEIEDPITVGALADKLLLPVSKLIGELMKNGVMATVNERIDFDTAQIIVGELNLDIDLAKKSTSVSNENSIRRKTNASGDSRPPVVAVMGHVDHGKTSLLDAIRGEDTAKSEAGGITQHISAYQISHNDRAITFLDTPGHEAFAAIREHGALLTDAVVVVVAADDGVKPQTVEAIRFARKAGVKIIVAINKIDKDGANIPQLKQQLAEQDLLVEEWGGDTIVVEVSAKTGQGLSELLDMILLVADVEDLKADVNVPATGLVIEAHFEQGRGPVAIGLIDEGMIKKGDYVVAGSTYAKIRSLESTNRDLITQASPSMPVLITGFKELPQFGDEFYVVKDEKTARNKAQVMFQQKKHDGSRRDIGGSELIRIINRTNKVNEFPVIIKADVQGSLTSVIDSIKTLDSDEATVRIVSSGVGSVSESDAHIASSTGAVIYGFNISLPQNIKRLASRDKTSIRLYDVIYELIDDVKVELSKLLPPEIIETDLGRLIVKGIFKTTKTEIICGGEVSTGKLIVPAMASVYRGKDKLGEVQVVGLRRGPQETKEVFEGEMCGLNLATSSRIELQENDEIQLFARESVSRHL